MHNITAIIQARVGSTRLPGKVFLELEGKKVLEHIIERVKSSKFIEDIVVATTVSKKDLEIVKFCSSIGISVYCGSEEDVLDRYYQTARLFKMKHIVRITSDCPLMDPKVIDKVLNLHLRKKSDYTSNTLEETYPDGQDVEIFTFEALKIAWMNAKLPSEREHVTPYIRKNSKFKKSNLKCNKDYSNKRWTLDNPEDYEFIKKVYENLYNKRKLFGMKEVLEYIKTNPKIEKINHYIGRNEGYLKSLKNDKNLKLVNPKKTK
ncbi:MAG: glycosyltransferase family protein [bacterium]|nr:glycosyltransferase family protein [bacterium]